jgi:hypothetical protein
MYHFAKETMKEDTLGKGDHVKEDTIGKGDHEGGYTW